MQVTELLKYIQNPQALNKQSVKQLQKLVEDFPYFQPAHLLLSMAAKKWDASVYQQSLKKTAIVATNRAHLFHLIHQIGNEVAPVPAEIKTIAVTVQAPEQQKPVDEDQAKHELNILKAAEVAVEQNIGQEELARTVTETAVTQQGEVKVNKPVPDAEAVLEKEIQNQVVNSFVEKEILKTPDLHHPKPKATPESFVEWLSLLKKNNGQTYSQINEQLNAEKLRQRTVKPAEEKTIPETTNLSNSKKEKNRALIDKIIESSPGIIRSKEEQKFFTATTHAKESLLDNEHLVTETLAKIYALQGSVNKAVRAYEILSLKFPQKSAYFATLIQKLKSNP